MLNAVGSYGGAFSVNFERMVQKGGFADGGGEVEVMSERRLSSGTDILTISRFVLRATGHYGNDPCSTH